MMTVKIQVSLNMQADLELNCLQMKNYFHVMQITFNQHFLYQLFLHLLVNCPSLPQFHKNTYEFVSDWTQIAYKLSTDKSL